ncbi:MAG: hypothetical protein FP825_07265 [Hyphomonas sp.]|uniref:hypothetical protein n=1 Tax=Hyphomonas sp. TaxID=87 RepID=UPI00183198F7|nr:hypothetical protein [Hyphomonas sp.]MBA3068261.1 hypothetical protein [Hyphomonas sp.]MBU3921151.1 hypothetical protein [Alphaproteobacteria bacterium]MBU4060873.1 hypothetical protein [Alphaproteobacteria bacterium]MBU4164857.1 hypothetical protein [Alphaproteobacteria bacterium]
MSETEGYYRTDSYALFLESLRFSQLRVLETKQNVRSMPWAIIGTHTLVQLSCILVLDERDTTQTACLSDQRLKGGKSVRETTVELIHAGKYNQLPEPYLASPTALLKRVQGTRDVMGTEAFNLAEDMKWNLEKLNEFRDMVIHFLPSSWNLDLSGMPGIFRSAFEFAFLVLQTPGTYRHRMGDHDRDNAIQLCRRMIDALNGGE